MKILPHCLFLKKKIVIYNKKKIVGRGEKFSFCIQKWEKDKPRKIHILQEQFSKYNCLLLVLYLLTGFFILL